MATVNKEDLDFYPVNGWPFPELNDTGKYSEEYNEKEYVFIETYSRKSSYMTFFQILSRLVGDKFPVHYSSYLDETLSPDVINRTMFVFKVPKDKKAQFLEILNEI